MIFFDNKLELMNTIIIIIIIIFLLFYFVGAYFKSIENFNSQYNYVGCPPQFTKVAGNKNDIYYNSGNVGINVLVPSYKLEVGGNFKCNYIAANKIGLGTSANHLNTLLDVRGDVSFGHDGSTEGGSTTYSIILRNPGSVWNIQADNLGTNNSGRFVISRQWDNKIEYITIDSGNEYIDIIGSTNITGTYNMNGNDVRNYTPFYENQIVQTIFAPYKKMAMKENTESGWVFIDNNTQSGFVISITPKSSQSGILLDLKMHFGLEYTEDARWWGAKLYRKIGTGPWSWIRDAGGDFSSNDGAGVLENWNGTSCWFGDTSGVNADSTMGTCCASYMDHPSTTDKVYYTIAVKCRLGETDAGGNGNERFYINRSRNQGDPFRPAPMSSWTAQEIWKGSTEITNVAEGL